MEHVFLASARRVILDPGALFSFPAARLHVFVLIIIRSVLMLGRRTLGATTPQASLSRRFILRVALCLGWKQISSLFQTLFKEGRGEKGKERSTRHGAPCRERNRLSDLTRLLEYYTPLAPSFVHRVSESFQLLLRIRLPLLRSKIPLHCFESSRVSKWTSFSTLKILFYEDECFKGREKDEKFTCDGGNMVGDPKVSGTFLWWFGAISNGKPATTNSW